MRHLFIFLFMALLASGCGAPEQADTLQENSPEDKTDVVTTITNGQNAVKTPKKPAIEIELKLPEPDSEETGRDPENPALINIDDIGNLGIGEASGYGEFGTGGNGEQGGSGVWSGGVSEPGLGSGGGYGSGNGAGTGAKTEPGSAADKQRKMRKIFQNLKTYPIAYETPNAATQDTIFDVTLAIDASGDDSAAEGLPQRQRITENVAKLSKLVEAKLSGAAFEIKASNARTQMLLPHRETVWRWSVKPLQAGDHELYLEIFANVGDGDAIMLESFSDLITVDVAPAADKPRLIEDARLYISVFGGLISLILGMIALSGHLKNKRETMRDENSKEET